MNPIPIKDRLSQVNPLRRKEALTISAIAALYLILWLILPKPSFWGIDNGIKFQSARSFAATGEIGIPYHGLDFDPQGAFCPITKPFGGLKGGVQVPVFSVSFIILSGIFYFIFGNIGPHLVSLLGGWACLLSAWFLWTRYKPKNDGCLFLLILGLGSPLLFYSLTLWEHTIAMALVMLSFAFLIHDQSDPVIDITESQNTRYWEVTASGILVAFAALFRTEAVFCVAIPLFYWRATERTMQDSGRYLVGFAAGIVVLLLLNQWQTGDLIPLHVISNIKANRVFGYGYNYLFGTRLDNLYAVVFQGFAQKYKSFILLAPLVITAVWRGWRYERDWGYYLAAGILGVWGIYFFSLLHTKNPIAYTMQSSGLLWVVPFVFLAILPLKSKRVGRFWRLIWIMPIAYFIIISAATPIIRGIHWGPRFIILALPLMLLTASTRAQRWWNRHSITRPVIVVLILISIANQFYSYNLLWKQRTENAALNRWAASVGSEPSLTNMWWLPGDVSTLSDRFPWFLTDTPGRVQVVVNALRDKGEPRFSFYERPPYYEDKFWWESGAEPLGEDYFLDGDGRLRRRTFRIVRSSSGPE
ncbi:hypothetical protein K9N50_09410 [bacterium]|nr:hypothetical protein [bacterium]